MSENNKFRAIKPWMDLEKYSSRIALMDIIIGILCVLVFIISFPVITFIINNAEFGRYSSWLIGSIILIVIIISLIKNRRQNEKMAKHTLEIILNNIELEFKSTKIMPYYSTLEYGYNFLSELHLEDLYLKCMKSIEKEEDWKKLF
jgi:hypothetical protein